MVKRYTILNMLLAACFGALLVLAPILGALGKDALPYYCLAFIAALLGFWPDAEKKVAQQSEGGQPDA